MTYKDIIALANAGYTADQIGQLARVEQMEPAAAPVPQPAAAPVQQPTAAPVQQPAAAPVQPADYSTIMAELLGIKQAVQAGNLQQAQQPAVMTPDAILANIIAPKPRGKEDM